MEKRHAYNNAKNRGRMCCMLIWKTSWNFSEVLVSAGTFLSHWVTVLSPTKFHVCILVYQNSDGLILQILCCTCGLAQVCLNFNIQIKLCSLEGCSMITAFSANLLMRPLFILYFPGLTSTPSEQSTSKHWTSSLSWTLLM